MFWQAVGRKPLTVVLNTSVLHVLFGYVFKFFSRIVKLLNPYFSHKKRLLLPETISLVAGVRVGNLLSSGEALVSSGGWVLMFIQCHTVFYCHYYSTKKVSRVWSTSVPRKRRTRASFVGK